MYYELDKTASEKYNDGQLLYYTPRLDFGMSFIIVVEHTEGYSAKQPGIPTETNIDPHYLTTSISDTEVFPISEESHPEIFFKFGFRI